MDEQLHLLLPHVSYHESSSSEVLPQQYSVAIMQCFVYFQPAISEPDGEPGFVNGDSHYEYEEIVLERVSFVLLKISFLISVYQL